MAAHHASGDADTLVYAAVPTALTWSVPAQAPDLPTQWHPVIAALAAQLLMLKEGKGKCQQAMAQMEKIIQAEPLRRLLKQIRAEQYRERAIQAREAATAER